MKLQAYLALNPIQQFSLQFGICKKELQTLSLFKGSNPKNRTFKLKRFQNSYIIQQFDIRILKILEAIYKARLQFLWDIRIYRGVRHKLGLPARGQRTHTNRKTKRKFHL